mgnify:CR=1 FL=1
MRVQPCMHRLQSHGGVHMYVRIPLLAYAERGRRRVRGSLGDLILGDEECTSALHSRASRTGTSNKKKKKNSLDEYYGRYTAI